jgi:ATP-dependent Zn protease
MRGYETARQIVEKQRVAVKVLAEELLDVESVDADRLKQIVAQHVVPAEVATPFVPAALEQST